jgi:hypothetical protein
MEPSSACEERRGGEKVIEKKRGARRPLEYDSPKVDVGAYFFFDDFFAGFLADFFFAAIKLTYLSCRTGPHGRAYLAKSAGLLRPIFRGLGAAEIGETTTFNIHRTFEVVFPVPGDHRFNLSLICDR